jgi:hypothetical protein
LALALKRGGERYPILHRHLDALTPAGELALVEGGQDAEISLRSSARPPSCLRLQVTLRLLALSKMK